MVTNVLRTMIEYFGQDLTLTNHCIQVHSLAQIMGRSEGLDADRQYTLECAAALHDIGIPESIRTYGSATGTYHEAMGYKVASELLTALGFDPEPIARIVFLIAHHHSYDVDGGTALQILIEADLLATLGEEETGGLTPVQVAKQHFRTKSGREMLGAMYGLRPEPPKNLIEMGFLKLPELSRISGA